MNDKHIKNKKLFKILGISFSIIGLVCVIIGMVSFFKGFNNMEAPKLFYFCFIGIPFLGIGINLFTLGFKGEILKYNKNESVPVINEASGELKPAIKNVVDAVKDGFGNNTNSIVCSCGTSNDKNSKYCKNCGKPLYTVCPNCGANCPIDSKYCNNCGSKL